MTESVIAEKNSADQGGKKMSNFKVKVTMKTSTGEKQTVAGKGMLCFVDQGDGIMSSAVGRVSKSMYMAAIELAETAFPGAIIAFILRNAADI